MYSGVSGQCSRALGGECYVFRGVGSMCDIGGECYVFRGVRSMCDIGGECYVFRGVRSMFLCYKWGIGAMYLSVAWPNHLLCLCYK